MANLIDRSKEPDHTTIIDWGPIIDILLPMDGATGLKSAICICKKHKKVWTEDEALLESNGGKACEECSTRVKEQFDTSK